MLYSEGLKQYSEELPLSIQLSLKEIESYFSISDLKVLDYSNEYIALPVVFSVSLPPLGTIGGIDIREEEPVLILISKNKYPNQIPSIISDRKDFPKDKLSHLYASRKGMPGKLCLVRNNPNEWFANKTICDFLTVGAQWFFKAAAGLLNEDGNEFDPTRLEGFTGYHVYSYETLKDIVDGNLTFHPDFEFAILFSYINKYSYINEVGFTIKSLTSIPLMNIGEVLKKISEAKNRPEVFPLASPALSLLVWNKEQIDQQYCTDLPKSFGGLKEYFSSKGVNIENIIDFYVNNGFHLRNEIPIIHAILRPKKIVGQNGNYEFLNFVIRAENFKNGLYPDSAIVLNQSHIEPFSKKLAERLTGEVRAKKKLYLGAGSLGSKIIIHEARSGNLQIDTIDDDILLEHNMARHALFKNKVGENKAEAIISEISDFYPLEINKKFNGHKINLTNMPIAFFEQFEWLVDSTASLQVQNWLVTNMLPSTLNIARCELVDDGQLGLLYVEGESRNPRIDDLINLTYYYARKDEILQAWRKRDAIREITNIDIGLGCSSTTTVMSDDIISLHSAVFSRILYTEEQRANIKENGLIYLSSIQMNGISNVSSKHYLVKNFEVYTCNANSSWEIRLMNGLTSKLIGLCRSNRRIETGGILVGLANYKTKTIHVFEIIEETKDSAGSYTSFQRGVKGLPQLINTIKQETGEVIGYIGEWHTHPMGLENLSMTDKQTIQDLIAINKRTPIPTCAFIVTNSKVIPYVFD